MASVTVHRYDNDPMILIMWGKRVRLPRRSFGRSIREGSCGRSGGQDPELREKLCERLTVEGVHVDEHFNDPVMAFGSDIDASLNPANSW